MNLNLLNRRARTAPVALLAMALAIVGTNSVAAAAETADTARLQQQLDEARGRLDDAARDVADLSRKLYGDDMHGKPMSMAGRDGSPHGAMLGINVGGGTDRTEGVEVMSVSPAGPAEAAGLRKGDVIVAVDGKALGQTDQRNGGRLLVEHLRGVTPGQKVKLDYLRDGKKLSTSVTTVAAEPPMFRMLRERMPLLEGMALPHDFENFMTPGGRGFRALELVPMTPKLGQYFGTDKGLLVVKAPTATSAGLEEGDVVLTIGGRTPESTRHAFRIFGSYEPKETLKVEIMRQRKRMTVDVQVPESGAPQPRVRPTTPVAPPTPPVTPSQPAGKDALSS